MGLFIFIKNFFLNSILYPFRLRVEHMERQLASLTGLVQKALAAPVRPTPPNQQIPTRDFAKDRGQGGNILLMLDVRFYMKIYF